MAADDFFSRWSQRKTQADHAEADPHGIVQPKCVDGAATAATAPEETLPPPTLDDVEKLTQDSDFSRFVRNDVDESVKRSALKKLFTNPHFNVMDGLDVYIDDYNKFTPMTPALLASLKHAKDLLNPPGLKKLDIESSDGREATQVPMEMLSSQDDAAMAGEQEAEPDQSNVAETVEAPEVLEAAETAGENLDAQNDVTLSFASDRAAERMPDDSNKEKSSPQGDS